MAEETTDTQDVAEGSDTPEATEGNGTEAERLTLAKLAGRGEEALRNLAAELDKHERIHDAKDRAQRAGRSALHQLNIASVEELEELRGRLAELEERIAQLEKGG